jgi:hypothetical protein
MTGRLDLKVPCKNCPFADRPTRIKFSCRERAREIAESAYRNGFPCHLSATDTSDIDEENGGFVFAEKTQHCAGAIGMFINDDNYGWPGVDNDEDIDDGTWEKAKAVAFKSEDAFIEANRGPLDDDDDDD